ncbi:MAG: hypothetical protein M0R77_10635 [Gammaproteobacteria bacterium]|nr:hypothetical protein [Gammaproteobacteria bacterium]
MYKDSLKEARIYLKSIGKTEYHLTDDHMAADLFDQLQAKRQEINEAKVAAMKEVAAKYDEQLNDIEDQYSTLLRMIA